MKVKTIFCGLFFLIGIAAGWTAKSFQDHRRTAENESAPLLLNVPDVLQSLSYSCGASALQAVLAYWGTEVHEDELMGLLGTTEQRGTPPDSILRVARSYGLAARMREGANIQDIGAALAKGIPVIVDIQAWPQKSANATDWDTDWEDGHYVIVVGLDDKNIYVEDPSLFGCRGFLPIREFEFRWHDYEGDPPYGQLKRTYVRMAIFIEGSKKPRSALYCSVK
jgi:uncharacterized protein